MTDPTPTWPITIRCAACGTDTQEIATAAKGTTVTVDCSSCGAPTSVTIPEGN